LKKTFYPALARVILRQPFMRVGIIGEATKTPCFVHVPSIDLYQHIRWDSITSKSAEQFDIELMEIAAMQHDQLWPELHARPPWKLRVAPRPGFGDEPASIEVIYAYHHAISDGLSGKIFHSQLLEALNSPNSSVPGLSGSILSLKARPVLPQPQEEVIDFKITFLYLLSMLWKEFGPKWLAGPPAVTPWGGEPVNLSAVYQTNVWLVNIPAPAVSKVLAACRTHSTTLTALVHILVLASLSRRLPSEEAKSFSSDTAISLRPYVWPQTGMNDTMQVVYTGQSHNFDAATVSDLRQKLVNSPAKPAAVEDLVWKLATSLKADLKRKTDSLPVDDMVGLLKWVSDWHVWFKKKDGLPRDTTWGMSNLGVIAGTDGTKSWEPKRLVFSQSAMIAGAAIGVNLAGVAGGDVSMTVTWPEGTVDNTMVRGLAVDVGAWLRRFGEEGSFGILPLK